MAFASIGSLGSVSAHGSANTIVLTTSATLEAGGLGAAGFSFDNLGSGADNADASEVTGVVDSAGNTWTKCRETSNNNGAAAAGVTISAWRVVAVNQLTAGGTITATLSGNATARTATAWEFSKGAGTTLAIEQGVSDVGDTADPASVALTSMPSREYLLLYFLGGEQNNAGTYTADADYTALDKTGTSAGGSTDIMVCGDFRIATLTDDTHDSATGTDRDYAAVYFALYEVAADDISARYQMNTPGVMIFSPGQMVEI